MPSIFLYQGFLTKGLKGRIVWHPKEPVFDRESNDWRKCDSCADVTVCVNDPWPDTEGGPSCRTEIAAP